MARPPRPSRARTRALRACAVRPRRRARPDRCGSGRAGASDAPPRDVAANRAAERRQPQQVGAGRNITGRGRDRGSLGMRAPARGSSPMSRDPAVDIHENRPSRPGFADHPPLGVAAEDEERPLAETVRRNRRWSLDDEVPLADHCAPAPSAGEARLDRRDAGCGPADEQAGLATRLDATAQRDRPPWWPGAASDDQRLRFGRGPGQRDGRPLRPTNGQIEYGPSRIASPRRGVGAPRPAAAPVTSSPGSAALTAAKAIPPEASTSARRASAAAGGRPRPLAATAGSAVASAPDCVGPPPRGPR